MLATVGLVACSPATTTTPGPASPPESPTGASTDASTAPTGPTAQTAPAAPTEASRPETASVEARRLELTPAGAHDAAAKVNVGGTLPGVEAEVVVRGPGTVLVSSDPWGRATFRLPAFTADPEPPRAIIRVLAADQDAADPLDPGVADFSFGADFVLDPESEGTEVDGGNNLMQRGLASDPSQFKIDVDDHRPQCRISGPDGEAELKAQDEITPGTWYRARCSRTGGTVSFVVTELESPEDGIERIALTTQVRTVNLTWKDGTPLSVGGKLRADGQVIRSATDQFNGEVSEPFLEIHPGR